jgi:hypothetical protein
VAPILAAFGFVGLAASGVVLASCFLDLAIGVMLLARWRRGMLAGVQLALVAVYTVALTYAAPSLWIEPFGPLVKNLPIMVAIMILAAIEHDR